MLSHPRDFSRVTRFRLVGLARHTSDRDPERFIRRLPPGTSSPGHAPGKEITVRSSPAPAPILWRRLDLPGHDAASLEINAEGAVLSGMAVFREGAPTALAYVVQADRDWQTSEAHVWGWRGREAIDLRLRRDDVGTWTLNDAPCPSVQGCVDLDLSFTPATNLLPLRRLALGAGQSAEVRSAWLEWPEVRLTPLVQRYLRRSETEYEYESDLPGAGLFRAVLRVEPDGLVLDYPGLWQAEG
jgi:hypothetical protein